MKKRLYHLRNSALFEYFYSFVLLSFIITAVMGGALYYYASSIQREEAIVNNGNTLTLIKESQELVLSKVDESMQSVFLDNLFTNYMEYYRKLDHVMLLYMQDKLSHTVSVNEYLHSIYLYFENEQFILSSVDGPMPLVNFKDSPFVEQIPKLSFSENFLQPRMITDQGGTVRDSVITIARPLPVFFTGKANSYVVVNIKASYLLQMLDSIQIDSQADLMIIGDDNTMIAHKRGQLGLYRDVPEEMVDLYSSVEAGYEVGVVNGVKSVISYTSSEEYEWLYIYSIPMAAVMPSLAVWGKFTMLVCLGIIAFSFIYSFLFSRKLYSPLRRVVLALQKHSPEVTDKDNVKELYLIEENVTEIVNKNESLERMLGEYEIYRKNKYLADLLTSRTEFDAQTIERLGYYELSFDEQGDFVCFVISMDDYETYAKQHPVEHINVLMSHINEVIAKELLSSYRGFISESETNYIAVLVQIDSDRPKPNLYKLAHQLQTNVNDEQLYTFTIGISNVHQGIGCLSKCYYEAKEASEFRFFVGFNNIILFDNIASYHDNVQFPFETERVLLNALKTGDRDKVDQSLLEFKQYIYTHSPDNEDFVKYCFFQLYSSSTKCLFEVDSSLAITALNSSYSYSALLQCKTMQDMMAYMNDIYRFILDSLENKRNMKNAELVERVIRYIASELGEDLSVERVSEQFLISSSYLRKIFKDHTGITIKQFIHQERIHKAKQLLTETDVKINDIATQIGYLSSQAFSKAFKAEIGKSPLEYRHMTASHGTATENKS